MVTAVEPDLEITLNRHVVGSTVSRNAPTRSGSTLSSTNNRGRPSAGATSWNGEFSAHAFDGHGVFEWSDGERFEGEWREARLFEMDELEAGNAVRGPAVIEAPATTLYVPSRFRVALDRYRVFELEREG